MWPWEHAAFAYVLYSLTRRVLVGSAPSGEEALLLAFAAVVPDLIDKPLSWQFGVFESSYALGHSVFFAIPLSAVAVAVAIHGERPGLGTAFAAGYLSHLPADLIPVYVRTGTVPVERLLWPATTPPPAGTHASLTDGIRFYFEGYAAEILSGDPSLYVLAQITLAALVVALWIVDGMPGVEGVRRLCRRVRGGPA